MPDTALTITHTHAEGTRIHGTAKGDGTGPALKTVTGQRWKFSRALNCWVLPGTRDRKARRDHIDRSAAALRGAGFDVTVRIDDRPRPAAEVEADRAARQADRVAALAARAERRHGRAEDAGQAAARARSSVPPMGQPILIGHHSEGRHRRALARVDAAETTAYHARQDAHAAELAAHAAEATTPHRHDPRVTLERIGRLEAERNRLERRINGHRRVLFTTADGPRYQVTEPAEGEHREQLTRDLAQVEDQLSYWREQVADAERAGVLLFGPAMLRVGDYVRKGQSWHPYPVERVNPKTVTVGTDTGRRTLPYSRITAAANSDDEILTYTDGHRSDGR